MTELELYELALSLDALADEAERGGPYAALNAWTLRATAEAIREVLPEGGQPIHLVNAAAAGYPL